MTMNFVKDAISQAIESTKLNLREVDAQLSSSIRQEVEQLYGEKKSSQPLWERLTDDVSRHDPDGWKTIGDYPYQNKVTMFFDYENESTMYSLNNVKDVTRLLSECPGFVFYVTNDELSFLLCHNDHDYLIGAGDAKNWIVESDTILS